jgi:hypothetical protein
MARRLRAMVEGRQRYALLPAAPANRVYGAAMPALVAAELRTVGELLLPGRFLAVRAHPIAGVDYVVLETDGPLDDAAVGVVGATSATQALFEWEEDGRLRPMPVARPLRWDDDLLTIPKYAGKTNELFTRLLVNVTLAAVGTSPALIGDDQRRVLLDPLCGRGTTLDVAILYGLDAIGVEVARKETEAYATFLVQWLKDKRIKHQVEREVHRKGREQPVRRFHASYRRKGEPEASSRSVEVLTDDTVHLLDHVRRRSVDVIVTDAPYGVQHTSRPSGGGSRRRPEDGALGLAWNRRTLDRDRLVTLLLEAGFCPLDGVEPEDFVHVVDRTITRDLVVARRSPRGDR